MIERRFPLNDGPLALNLVNTVPSDQPGRDLLTTTEDTQAWLAAQNEVLSAPLLAQFTPGTQVRGVAPGLDAITARLRDLRAVLRSLLDAATDGAELPPEDVDRLNDHAALAPQRPQLIQVAQRWRNVPSTEGATPGNRLLAAIAESGIHVLARPVPPRRCRGPGCRLLFVGGHPRRTWCDSRTCGNRVRVARHSARQ